MCQFLLFLLPLLRLAVTAQILLYNGDGTSPQCVEYTRSTFAQLTNLPVNLIDAKFLIESPDWEANTRALIIPGGRDLPYQRDLEPHATDRIRKWVQEAGGIYIGICAGAYFACRELAFEEDRPQFRVTGNRQLALYEGIAKGPLYPYPQAKILTLFSPSLDAFYLGGPFFQGDAGYEVILRYAENGEAAVVMGSRGKGQVLLMGVHLEVDHYLEGMRLGYRLKGWRSQEERLGLLRQLLHRLGLI